MIEWQTMNTAPKIGQVLLWDKTNEQFYVGHWNKSEMFWSVGCFEFIEDESRLMWVLLPDKP